MTVYIASYCRITSAAVFVNGAKIRDNENAGFDQEARAIYKQMEIDYPKFYKMDNLSKLGFLAGELLMKNSSWADGEKVAIIVGNKNSSLDTDTRHYESIRDKDDYFPSPAVFVYTLPNIMLGELCIRHGIKGENSCFLMDHFDPPFFNEYVHDLFRHEDYSHCITGWIDYTADQYEAYLFLITRQKSDTIFTPEELKRLISDM